MKKIHVGGGVVNFFFGDEISLEDLPEILAVDIFGKPIVQAFKRDTTVAKNTYVEVVEIDRDNRTVTFKTRSKSNEQQ